MKLANHVLLLLAMATPSLLPAEEGMWTFDNPPLKQLKEKYGFTPDQAWLDHLRLSSLHWGGASGSFVSADGLVLTNHHVGRRSLQRISTKEHDYLKNGFVARTREEEIPIPGLRLRTLMYTENVTEKVLASVKAGLPEKDAARARKLAFSALRDEAAKRTKLQCDTVTLYQGGEYWIYGYKRYTDVRLVAAPELQLGSFGGDPDNFTYPRHDLDFCAFRVYENGKPYHPEHYLRVAKEPLMIGDLTFVSGHPGSTNRLWTYAQMLYARDVSTPLQLKALERQRQVCLNLGKRNAEALRLVTTRVLGLENSLKANRGNLEGLQNAKAMKDIKDSEDRLQLAVTKNPKLKAMAGASWARIEQTLKNQKPFAKELQCVGPCGSTLLEQALFLLRLPEEMAKPAEKRLPDFAGENRIRTEQERLLDDAPYFPELEVQLLTSGLREAQIMLGSEHPFLKAMLDGQDPETVARKVVEGSRMHEVAFRKQLLDGGKEAMSKCQDPMVLLARKLDPVSRALIRKHEELSSIIEEHSARIARARFAIHGKDVSPDATRTLRLSYGAVKGYPANGTLVQPFTTFYGLYDRALGWGSEAVKGSWALPQRWWDAKTTLNMETPLNFCHTVDTVGGNSGSPVLNAKGELVGLLFDGNYEGLANRYYYDETVNRSVSVDIRAVLESLDKVYKAGHIVKEIKGE